MIPCSTCLSLCLFHLASRLQVSSMSWQMAGSSSFSWLSNTPFCAIYKMEHIRNGIYIIPHVLYSSVDGHLGCFQVVGIVSNAAVSTECRYLFDVLFFISLGHIPRRGIAGSYGSSSFHLLRTLHTVFHSGRTNLHAHQQCVQVPVSLKPWGHLLSLVFLTIAILTGAK